MPVRVSTRQVVELARRHAVFLTVAVAGTGLRVVVMLAYPGALWFNDSRSYIRDAVHLYPFPGRPQGYALFLRMLQPLHSMWLVAGVQHLFGLAMGVAVYVAARRAASVRGWVAALAAAPVLLDAYQLQLEHLLMSDVLFAFYLVLAVAILVRRPRSVPCTALAGLLVGLAAITRSIGLPLVIVVAGCLIVRRAGWRPVTALLAACAAPVAGYAIWFHSVWGHYAITDSDGIFLYGRVTTFVSCDRTDMPTDLTKLCPHRPIGERPVAPDYIWHVGYFSKLGGADKFNPANNDLARRFSYRAITHQPLGYLRTSLAEFGRTFHWRRTPYPHIYDTVHWMFPDRYHLSYPGRKAPPRYAAMRPGKGTLPAMRAYSRGSGIPRVVEPEAAFLRSYQRYIYLRGTLFGVILLAGLVAMAPLWRRAGGTALLPWLISLLLVAGPPFTASFSYRYVLPAVPLACLALAIAIGENRAKRRARPADQTSPGSDPSTGGSAQPSRTSPRPASNSRTASADEH